MDNTEKLKKAFSEALEISTETITDDLSYGSESWDSVAHLSLVAIIETEFDVMFGTNDVLDMSSFKKAKEILQKYDIKF
jgi:acyl carrier protein